MGFGWCVKSLAAALLPRTLLVGGAARTASTTKVVPAAALTFDDGPHPWHTPRILAALADAGARATFFLQGCEAARHPGLVRLIHEAGHQVANHAFTHRDARQVPAREYIAEVLRTQELLSRIVQCKLPADFRPPYGTITPATFLPLARQGFRFVFWSKDSQDSFTRDPGDLAAAVDLLDIGPGDIVLFHEDYAHTVDALPQILDGLKRRALPLVAVADLGTGR